MILKIQFPLIIFYAFTIPHSEFLKFVKSLASKPNSAFSAAYVEAEKMLLCLTHLFIRG